VYETSGWALACVLKERTLSNFKLMQVNQAGIWCYEKSLWISIGY